MMVNTSQGVGNSGVGGGLSPIRDSATRDSRATRQVGGGSGGTQGATPNGPRGRRLLAAGTPVESLDRGAPRGTYVDILA
ncbi:MAG: hypothetical protein HY055_01355 [Magnetospirillum sp.]|nr:hypothetical protein [Magnetospirillum sp.]